MSQAVHFRVTTTQRETDTEWGVQQHRASKALLRRKWVTCGNGWVLSGIDRESGNWEVTLGQRALE